MTIWRRLSNPLGPDEAYDLGRRTAERGLAQPRARKRLIELMQDEDGKSVV